MAADASAIEGGTSADDPSNFGFEKPEAGPSPASASKTMSIPGAKFAANSSAVLRKPSSSLQTEQFHGRPDAASEFPRSGMSGDTSPPNPAPDFKSALDASALRKAEAEQAIAKILSMFDSSPAKKRAVNKVRKEITSALSDE